MNRHFSQYISPLMGLVALCSCYGCTTAPKSIDLAKVGDQTITLEHFLLRMNQTNGSVELLTTADPARYAKVKTAIIYQMVEEELILLRGRQLGIQPTEADINARLAELTETAAEHTHLLSLANRGIRDSVARMLTIKAVLQKEVYAPVQIREDEIASYYRLHRDRFKTKEAIRLSQILLKDASDAQLISRKLRQGEDFQKLAVAFSIAPEGKTGGDMGFIQRGNLPEELSKIAFALPHHQLSPIIQSPFGFHLLKVTDSMPSRILPLEEVSEAIREILLHEKGGIAYKQWMAKQAERVDIDINQSVVEQL